ncbi:hypothetical protein A176_007257 [Myxococcus hansupus]|uniref:Uncharacterized protein n=1 Tax=Pseudomyxococcus hansupus TaxID=1297742 RepID=A0A0H4X9S5_9BACT|nr:hypothetical protein A176_007257 [Myxococcus hansupus]
MEKVLNAFRHHGERDRDGYADFGGHAQVLNAFRHHGERDLFTQSYVVLSVEVLNAFRHHGERDQDRSASRGCVQGCSTHSGITASATPNLRPRST